MNNSRGTLENYELLCRDDIGYIEVKIPKDTWYTIQCVEPCVLFECKEVPYLTYKEEGIMEAKE
jgi:hypothetical protein